MTDKTDDTGKRHSRPGDTPRRPYATIDATATEIGREQAAAPGGRKPAASALPPPNADTKQRAAGGAWASLLASGMAVAGLWARTLVRSSAFMSHAAAGVVGAAVMLAVAGLLGLLWVRQAAVPADLARRLAALEQAQARQAAVPAALADRLAAADQRLSALEAQAKAIAALKSEQAALAADTRDLQSRVANPETAERLAKLEAALAAVSAEANSAGAPTAAGLAATLAEVERLSGEAGAAKAAAARLERDLAALKAEAAGLRNGLEALKSAVEDRTAAKLAGFERALQAVRKTEAERAANAQRVLAALEITNLKRALDRGDSYARELDAARKVAGGAIDLTPLDRSSATGVPRLGALTQQFRGVANAAMDAEAEQADASVLDRLLAGARSVVRVRKARYDADDTSVEATLSRMENALEDGNIGEVLAQGQRLPPKAAGAIGGWLRQLEARYAADRAIAQIEAALKASLTGEPPQSPEPKR